MRILCIILSACSSLISAPHAEIKAVILRKSAQAVDYVAEPNTFRWPAFLSSPAPICRCVLFFVTPSGEADRLSPTGCVDHANKLLFLRSSPSGTPSTAFTSLPPFTITFLWTRRTELSPEIQGRKRLIRPSGTSKTLIRFLGALQVGPSLHLCLLTDFPKY